jgi:hypothetical protein
MFLHVIEARHVRDYTIWLRFNDGTQGEVDLGEELEGPLFGLLRDLERFKRFSLEHHTIAWEGIADLAPEFLREHVRVTV